MKKKKSKNIINLSEIVPLKKKNPKNQKLHLN